MISKEGNFYIGSYKKYAAYVTIFYGSASSVFSRWVFTFGTASQCSGLNPNLFLDSEYPWNLENPISYNVQKANFQKFIYHKTDPIKLKSRNGIHVLSTSWTKFSASVPDLIQNSRLNITLEMPCIEYSGSGLEWISTIFVPLVEKVTFCDFSLIGSVL